MKIDISDVKVILGSELVIEESDIIPDLKNIFDAISVTEPVCFKGVLSNMTELLSLKGKVTCTYETKCDYCTKPIAKKLQVAIDEVLVETDEGIENMTESNEYTYQGNQIVLDKILSDSIVLSMPMRHRCGEDCKIICPKCGEPVTGIGCGCNDKQPIDPRLVALKKLIDNQNADAAD